MRARRTKDATAGLNSARRHLNGAISEGKLAVNSLGLYVREITSTYKQGQFTRNYLRSWLDTYDRYWLAEECEGLARGAQEIVLVINRDVYSVSRS